MELHTYAASTITQSVYCDATPYQKGRRSSSRALWPWRLRHWLAQGRSGSPRLPRPSAQTCGGSSIPIQDSAGQNSSIHPLFCIVGNTVLAKGLAHKTNSVTDNRRSITINSKALGTFASNRKTHTRRRDYGMNLVLSRPPFRIK